ncbi:MAG TPA: CBS domain-containing protein [bacterium]|nr:CBS domain-containing protein [bacterium]
MSTPVVTVRPEATLKEVAEKMAAHRVSGLPVVDHLGHVAGIITESDILTKLGQSAHEEQRLGLLHLFDRLTHATGADRKLHARTAAELMTTPVITARPEASFRELIHLMTSHGINRIPIVEGGRVIGIVTRADLLRTLGRPDAAVTEDVRWRILHDLWVDTTGLDIRTHEGVVTIAGEVGTRSEVDLIKRWIAVTEGVVDVDVRNLRFRLDDRRIEIPSGRVVVPIP